MLASWVQAFGTDFIDPLVRQVRRLIDAMGAVAALDPTGQSGRLLATARTALDGLQAAPGGIADGLRGVADGIDRQGQDLIRGAVRGIGDGMRNAADVMDAGVNAIAGQIRGNGLPDALRGVGRDVNQAGQDLQREIAQLMREGDGDVLAFGARINQVVARWTNTLAGAARDIAEQVPAQVRDTYEKAITGHEAATADSQRAFTMQYGTKGNAEMYARQTAEAVTRQLAEVARVRVAMEGAPVIRRANLR
jgi:predicted small secreted protein